MGVPPGINVFRHCLPNYPPNFCFPSAHMIRIYATGFDISKLEEESLRLSFIGQEFRKKAEML